MEDSGNESILLFIKVFEQGSGLISYGGKFQVKNKMKPMTDLVKRVREKFKIPLNVRLRFLEVRISGCVYRGFDLTFYRKLNRGWLSE